MPDISTFNNIAMADIASFNGQTIPSGGGAYDPVAGTGTYTETVPTSGLLKFGGARIGTSLTSSTDSQETIPSFAYGVRPVVNISSDVDGTYVRVAESKSDFVHISYGQYSAFGITSNGELWEVGSNASYIQGNSETNFTRVIGVGDSDTGWTDVSASTDGALAINSGKMYHIGANPYGQAGTGNTTPSYGSFTQVGTDSDWQRVKRSRFFSMATKTTNNVLYVCGRNLNYQTGLGTSSGNTTSWTAINSTNFTNSNITDFGINYDGGYLITGGAVYVWGDEDTNMRFALNVTVDVQIPTQTGYVGGVAQTNWVTAGLTNNSMHLINSNGEYYFAGEATGRRGDGSLVDNKGSNFIQIGTDTDWQAVLGDPTGNTSNDYGIAALKGNKLYYWGYNQYGGVLDAARTNQFTATLILNQNLAAGNVWTTFPNVGSFTRFTVAAIY